MFDSAHYLSVSKIALHCRNIVDWKRTLTWEYGQHERLVDCDPGY
jgi:hypothetical protein